MAKRKTPPPLVKEPRRYPCPPLVRGIIQITPTPKGRPRFSAISGTTHTPKSTIQYENSLRAFTILLLGYERQDYPLYPKGFPLAVDFDFIIGRPGNLYRKKDPDGLIWKGTTPDGDNFEKAVLDALKGVVWEDDGQIVDMRWRKMYAAKEGKPLSEPSISFKIRPAGDIPAQLTCDRADFDRIAKEHHREGRGEFDIIPMPDLQALAKES